VAGSIATLVARLAGGAVVGGPAALAASYLRECAAAGTVPLGVERLHATLDNPARSAATAAPATAAPATAAPATAAPATASPATTYTGADAACPAEHGAGRLEDVLAQHPCVVLRADDTAAVAEGLAAVLGTGATVLVAGDDPRVLADLRAALPEPLHALCLDRPLPLADDECRELRMLLLTETGARRARERQWLPAPALVPSPARLAALGVAPPMSDHPDGGVALIPYLLRRMPREKAVRLVSTAATCRDALRALFGKGGSSWTRPLLERLAFGADHLAFDELMHSSAAVASAAESLNGPAYRMVIVGPPPPDATERLSAHIEHLESGGSTRRYFVGERQRSVTSLLRQLGMDHSVVGDVGALREALTGLELARSMRRVAQLCSELGVPEPTSTPAGVRRRHDHLQRLVEAVDAVGTLRREVLFIHPTSPVAVPDLAAAEAVAPAIIAASGALPQVRDELVRIAAGLHGPPMSEPAPEALELADALRAADLPGYRHALRRLEAARHERSEQARLAELLNRVRTVAPELAAAWRAGRREHGTARFLTPEELLAELPVDEPADVLMLVGADRMAPGNLLGVAAATRLVAVCPSGGGAGPDGTAGRETAASILLDAGAAQVLPAPSTPDVTAPDVTAPDVTAPDETVPDVTAAGVTPAEPGVPPASAVVPTSADPSTPSPGALLVPLQRNASPEGSTSPSSTSSERASA
jgi:hypothetical protein